jgi:3-deoxy-D-manno-octulosonate 8-phosphate phosphatase (KDO 8-P phosphatase)
VKLNPEPGTPNLNPEPGTRNPEPIPVSLQDKSAPIRLLLFDVDGVLTDGMVIVHTDGSESKGFHIRDGAAMVWAQRAGLTVGLLSARSSGATAHRAAQLGIRLVVQGVANKLGAYDRILRDAGLSDEAVAYMGDDLLDLPVLARAGLSAAPADAAVEVRQQVDWVSTHGGGRGAVRELIELVLRAQQRWDPVLKEYTSSS